ncbi:MAG: hypothetical protein EBR82_35490, partial [Caulobacteraceae bacterium]|nr:hypothetical protein [Caulobacteraceae bacterium]
MSLHETRPGAASVPVAVGSTDIRPVVASRRRPTPVWLFAGGAILAAVVLFVVLDGNRRARTAPSTAPRAADVVQTAPELPPLYIETEAAAWSEAFWPAAAVGAPVAPPGVVSITRAGLL